MQSNHSELPNVMSVADAKTFAAQRQVTSAHLLVYRGATCEVPKHRESNVDQVANSNHSKTHFTALVNDGCKKKLVAHGCLLIANWFVNGHSIDLHKALGHQ